MKVVARGADRRAAERRRRRTPRLPATRPPLRRLLWAMNRLRSGKPLKATDLAREFETSLRTAYRDFAFLEDQMGAPLEFDRRRGSYVLTEPTYTLPLASLSQGELVALFFAEKVVSQYRGTPYEEDLASAFRKIEELLPEEVTVDPNPLEEILSLDIGTVVAPHPEIFRAIVRALQRHRRISISFTSLSRG